MYDHFIVKKGNLILSFDDDGEYCFTMPSHKAMQFGRRDVARSYAKQFGGRVYKI